MQIWKVGCVAAAAWCAAAASALATDAGLDQASFDDRFEASVTPYVWMAGMKAELQFGSRFPEVAVDQSFGQILDALQGAFMGAAEIRMGRIGLMSDVFYARTILPVTTEDILYTGGSLEHDVTVMTLAATLRAGEGPKGHIDLLAGLRTWWTHSDLEMDGRFKRFDVSRKVSDNWGHAIAGVSARHNLNDRLFITSYLDVGGFNPGTEFSWQYIGTLGYAVGDKMEVAAGYRFLHFEHVDVDGLFTRKVNYSGPLLSSRMKY